MLKERLLVIAAIVGFAVFVACSGGGKGTGSGQPAGGQQEQARRGGTLLVAMEQNPKDFDPMVQGDAYSGYVTTNVFEGLYKYDENLKPQPWLAETIDQPDDTTYVFHLRRGVLFHDGSEMDAEAVKFSMDRIRNNPKSVGYKDADAIADTIVLDKYTLKLLLREPFAPLPSRLTGRLGAVVSPAAAKSMGDDKFDLNPVGTGPFRFIEFKNDSYVRVGRFDRYWRQAADGKTLPYLDAIEWRIITEPAERLSAMQAGDVHIAAIRDQEAKIVKGDANLIYAQQAGFSYGGLMLTINRPPFDNKSLRQAVQFAINRDEIIKAIYEGNREPANGMIPPTLAWAIDPNYKPYFFDQQKARQKLAEGGKPGGFEFTVWGASGVSTTQQLLELIQAQLAKVSIKMNIELADFNGVVVPKWQKGESNAYSVGITGGIDPDQWVSSPFLTGGSFNFFPYSNPQVDALIKQGRQTSNPEVRAKVYKELIPVVMEDSPYVFLTYGIDRFTGSKKVGGWYLGVKATTGYSEYWLKQ